jgi:hypothetical protein
MSQSRPGAPGWQLESIGVVAGQPVGFDSLARAEVVGREERFAAPG